MPVWQYLVLTTMCCVSDVMLVCHERRLRWSQRTVVLLLEMEAPSVCQALCCPQSREKADPSSVNTETAVIVTCAQKKCARWEKGSKDWVVRKGLSEEAMLQSEPCEAQRAGTELSRQSKQ